MTSSQKKKVLLVDPPYYSSDVDEQKKEASRLIANGFSVITVINDYDLSNQFLFEQYYLVAKYQE